MSQTSQEPWGHKQNKIIRRGEPVIRRKKTSLKKIAYCKKTKGDHVFRWVPYSRLSSSGSAEKSLGTRLSHEVCTLCGKRGDWGYYCYTHKGKVPWEWGRRETTYNIPGTHRYFTVCPTCPVVREHYE